MASTIEDKDTVKSQNVEYWVGEGKKFYEDKKYEEAIKCYEKVTKLAPNNALAFYNWGYALSELAKINQSQDEDLFKNSFEKYNKATQLNPNYASAFYNWGYALSDLAEIKQNEDLFKSAFEKYEEAVRLYEINTDKASAFYMWGYAILNLAEINQDETLFKSAFEKYEEAARLYETDTDKASAFYIWGYAILSLAKIKQDETFQKNLETFEIASEDINDSDIFLIKGELYFVLGKAEKTMKYFEKSKKDILEILTFLDKDNGEKIIETNFLHPLLDLDNNDGRFFTETIGLKPEDQREKYKKVYIRSIFIISLLHVNNENEKLVAHYCEKDISQTLLFSSDNKINKFRLNAIDYSNDPDEGKTLLNFLYEEKRPSDEKLNNEDYEAFAGCFVLDYDNLNMFRLYGKDGHSREGNGLSIVFRDNFFSKEAKMAFEKPKADSRM
jgi:tetratricopeptide (TPR) repeat protein